MRLLFVNEKLNYAGTSSYTLDLAAALREGGDEVRICTRGGDLRRTFSELGIETYPVRFNPFSFRKLLQFLRELRAEIIHIQNLRSAVFGRRFSRKLRLPYVVTVHRVPDAGAPRLDDPRLAGIIAVNEVIREALVNNLGVPKALVRVIPRGVDTRLLAPEREEGPGAGPGQDLIPVVGSIGSLAHVKGHHVFLGAARRVLDRGVEAVFAVVGEGEEEPELRRLVRELGLQHHVTFSPHIPSRRELYRSFDVIVVPTLRGGVGSTALEAMSMGKPVIATAVGEMLHIVQDGKTGLLVPEGDEEALADRIAELLLKPEQRRFLGETARARVVEGFSLTPRVKATRELYGEILAKLAEQSLAPQAAVG
ncbi:MAG: glycosyltransferase family 4 protein [Planctomycetes bacterium]|nr:glycosyltransferase family 4 protein [Planctomycetota bacterium]